MVPSRVAPRNLRWFLDRLGFAKWIIIGLLAGGTLLVLGGWRTSDQYWSAALLELGAALFIAAPLIFIERLMEGRIRLLQQAADTVKSEVADVRREVRDTRTRIEDLGTKTSDLIKAARAADERDLRTLRSYASEQDAWRGLRLANELGAVDEHGVRVRLPATDAWVRFTAELDTAPGDIGRIHLRAEDRGGDPFASEEWSADERPEEALARLGRNMQGAGRYPGDTKFDAAAIFTYLADTLETVVSLRTAGDQRDEPLSAVVELVGDWAVTVNGLESVRNAGWSVTAKELLDSLERTRAALVAGGVETDDRLSEALDTARAYHSATDRRRAQSRVPHSTGEA